MDRKPDRPILAFAVKGNDHDGPYEVIRLSQHGLIMRVEPQQALREFTHVLLGQQGCWNAMVPGKVIFKSEGGAKGFVVAVKFGKVPPVIQEVCPRGVQALPAPTSASCKGPTVLIVDDSVETCYAVARDLRALGCKAVAVDSLLDGIMCAINPEVDVSRALVDLRLGPYDGRSMLAILAELRPNVVRVLFSGNLLLDDLRKAMIQGQAHAMLRKPWSRQELRHALMIPAS